MLDPQELLDRVQLMADTIRLAQLTLLAGAIAFFALLSIVPLAVVIVALAATIGGAELIDPLIGAFDHLLTDDAVDIVERGLEADAGRSGATLTGIVFTVWASLRVFRALDRAFNSIYGRPGASNILDSAINGISVLVGVIGIVATVGFALISLYYLGFAVPSTVVPVVTIPLLALILLPMYTLFPPGPAQLRAAIPGAIIAAIGITLATAGLQLYIVIASPFAVYGFLAGIFIAMLWLYVIAIILLVGAVANATNLGADRQLHVGAPS